MLIFSLILLISSLSYCNGLGTRCQSNTECRGEEQCISGTCQCGTGQISYNGRCVTNSGICTGNQQVYFNGKCLHTVQINEQCETSAQCLGGSACFNGICICPTGTTNSNGFCTEQNGHCANNQIYIQNQCYNLATVGQQCQIASQCIGGANCVNGQCQCPSGTTLVGTTCQTSALSCPNEQVLVNGMCVGRVAPGQRCQYSLQCYDAAECATGPQLCVCPLGMFLLSGYCRKLSSDDPCDQTTSVYYNNNCLNVQRPGSNCQTSLQCLGGSECISGYCQCPVNSRLVSNYCVSSVTTCGADQVMVNSRCYSMVSLGQACQVSEQCKNNAECDYSAICSCPTGMQQVNGYCQQKQDAQCLDNQVAINGACYARVAPSSGCTFTQQCLDGSTCLNGICTCPTNARLVQNYCVTTYVGNCAQNQANVNGQCLELRQPGAACTNNLQCMGSSTCPSGTCVCSSGYANVMNYCVLQSTSSQCAASQVLINGLCFNYVSINQYCVYEQQCQGGAKCQNNYCTCPTGYIWQNNMCSNAGGNCAANQVYVNGICYNVANIGQTCQVSQQCQAGSACTNGYCQCPTGSYQSGNTCISSGGTVCNANQVNVNGICYNYASISQPCQVAQQCQGGSTCTNGYCQCPAGSYQQGSFCLYSGGSQTCTGNQVLINGVCYSYAPIGQTCQFSQQCRGGSQCANGICQCPAGTVMNSNMCINNGNGMCVNQVYISGQCYNLAQIGETCYYNEQCLGYSNCSVNRCTCPAGTTPVNGICTATSNCQAYQVYVNGQCLDRVTIGMQCTDNSQCIDSASCITTTSGSTQRTCQCNAGLVYTGSICTSYSGATCPFNTVFVTVNNCLALASIGQTCSQNSQCMGFANCTNSVCQCPVGQYNINGACRQQY